MKLSFEFGTMSMNILKEDMHLNKKSQLLAIIKRLEAMVDAEGLEPQVRRFENNGTERCIVTFVPTEDGEGTFEMEESDTHQVYQFDDVDLIAMEIYELLQG